MQKDKVNQMTDKITELITAELAQANAKFPPFHSCHEAYSVLREETEETVLSISTFTTYMSKVWEQVKKDDVSKADIEVLKLAAREIICEAIQVAAMCEKFSDFMKTQPDQDEVIK